MRNLTSGQKAKLAAKVKYVGLIVEIDYTPTPLRVWTGLGNVAWDGKTWAGVGALGGISAITEKIGYRAGSLKLTLNGVPSEHKAIALDDASQNRAVRVWLATFNVSGSTWSVVDAPNLMERGDTDVHEIVESGEAADRVTIEVTVETPLSRLTILSVLRATGQDQRLDFPDDEGMDYAEQIDEQVLYWPNQEPQATAGSASGSGGGGGSGGVEVAL